MSAPTLWIIVPGAAAVLLYLARRWQRVVYVAGMTVVILLAVLAWQLPINEPIALGIPGVPAWQLQESGTILGQELVVTSATQPALVLIYLGITMWMGGTLLSSAGRFFIPTALAVASLLSASVALQSKHFSVMLVAVVALICVPILSPPGRPIGRGVLRFLVFQILGMVLILMADWLIQSTRLDPDNFNLLTPATMILGLGFALIGGIFPFHTWIPMLAEEAHPYSAAFVFFILPATLSLLGLNYLVSFEEYDIAPVLFTIIRWTGLIMVTSGGIWALFERHLGRVLGYSAIAQVGMGLLAISLIGVVPANSATAGIFFAQLFPQIAAFSVWALALSVIQQKQSDLHFRMVQGIARKLPIATSCLSLASFSLAGVPLLASFPGNVALWSALTQVSLPFAAASLLGNAGLFAAALRSAAVLVMSPGSQKWASIERGFQPVFLLVGGLLMFCIGLLPQWFMPVLTNLATIFLFQNQ